MSKTIVIPFVSICYILFLVIVDSCMGSKSAVAVMLISAFLWFFVNIYSLPVFKLRRLPKQKYRIMYREMRSNGHVILLRDEEGDEDHYFALPSIFCFEGVGFYFCTKNNKEYLVPLPENETQVN